MHKIAHAQNWDMRTSSSEGVIMVFINLHLKASAGLTDFIPRVFISVLVFKDYYLFLVGQVEYTLAIY